MAPEERLPSEAAAAGMRVTQVPAAVKKVKTNLNRADLLCREILALPD